MSAASMFWDIASVALDGLGKTNWRNKPYYELGPTIYSGGVWLFGRGGLLGYGLADDLELLERLLPFTAEVSILDYIELTTPMLIKTLPKGEHPINEWYAIPTLREYRLAIPENNTVQGFKVPKEWTKRIELEDAWEILVESYCRGAVAGSQLKTEFREHWENHYEIDRHEEWEEAFRAGLVDSPNQPVLKFGNELGGWLEGILELDQQSDDGFGLSDADYARLQDLIESVETEPAPANKAVIDTTNVPGSQYCPNCGANHPVTNNFCTKCGTALSNAETTTSSVTENTRPTKARQVSLDDWLETAIKNACKRVGSGRLDKAYEACLRNSLNGAETLIKSDSFLTEMWGSGNDEKAAGIIEVWASTIAVWLFGGTSDQDDVTTQVAEYFSTVIFQTNPEVAFQELSVYQNERALSESTTNFVTVQWIVYLRCLRALGAEIDFADLPRPLSGTMKDDLIQSGIIQPRYVGSFESIMGIMPLILDGLQSAKRDFEKAR